MQGLTFAALLFGSRSEGLQKAWNAAIRGKPSGRPSVVICGGVEKIIKACSSDATTIRVSQEQMFRRPNTKSWILCAKRETSCKMLLQQKVHFFWPVSIPFRI
jgi:hypothetical protein